MNCDLNVEKQEKINWTWKYSQEELNKKIFVVDSNISRSAYALEHGIMSKTKNPEVSIEL